MKIKKVIYFFILCIVLISSVYAVPPTTVINNNNNNGLLLAVPVIQYVEQNMNRTFHVHVYNISNGLPITSGIRCNYHLYSPTGDHLIELNNTFASHEFDYEFFIGGDNFSKLGIYQSLYSCFNYTTMIGGEYKEAFEVTYNGKEPTSNIAFIFGVGIIIFALLYLSFSLDDKHTILKILNIFFAVIFGLLIPATLINNSNIIFYKLYLGFITVFVLYVIIFLVYFILRKTGHIVNDTPEEQDEKGL